MEEETNEQIIKEEDKDDGQFEYVQNLSYVQFMKESYKYGFISFGGPLAHIAMFEDNYVGKLKWIKQDKFVELFALCQSLPGPTSTQLMIAMGSLFTSSTFGGILAFLLFALPSALVMLTFGLLFYYVFEINGVPPKWLDMILHGFQSATVAVIGSAAFKLGNVYIDKPLYMILIILSCSLFMVFQNVYVMLILMLGGGVISYFFGYDLRKVEQQPTQPKTGKSQEAQPLVKAEDNQVQATEMQKMPQQQQQQQLQIPLIKDGLGPFGKISFILYVLVFISLFALRWYIKNNYIIISYSFYYIGSVIFGGGHVVIPLILEQFEGLKMITSNQFWTGFSIVSALPGPVFNISVYVGIFAGGIIGGILSWIMLFLPSFFMMWGFLPYFNKYKDSEVYQKIFTGLGSTSVGFILSATVLLWIQAANIDVIICSIVVIFSFILYHFKNTPVPAVILLGGVITFVKYELAQLYK